MCCVTFCVALHFALCLLYVWCGVSGVTGDSPPQTCPTSVLPTGYTAPQTAPARVPSTGCSPSGTHRSSGGPPRGHNSCQQSCSSLGSSLHRSTAPPHLSPRLRWKPRAGFQRAPSLLRDQPPLSGAAGLALDFQGQHKAGSTLCNGRRRQAEAHRHRHRHRRRQPAAFPRPKRRGQKTGRAPSHGAGPLIGGASTARSQRPAAREIEAGQNNRHAACHRRRRRAGAPHRAGSRVPASPELPAPGRAPAAPLPERLSQ